MLPIRPVLPGNHYIKKRKVNQASTRIPVDACYLHGSVNNISINKAGWKTWADSQGHNYCPYVTINGKISCKVATAEMSFTFGDNQWKNQPYSNQYIVHATVIVTLRPNFLAETPPRKALRPPMRDWPCLKTNWSIKYCCCYQLKSIL